VLLFEKEYLVQDIYGEEKTKEMKLLASCQQQVYTLQESKHYYACPKKALLHLYFGSPSKWTSIFLPNLHQVKQALT
jgi:hypothetical protein